MDFFEVVSKRRSIRRFTDEVIPDEWIEKAFEAASLAPNSSNAQTWDFHWIKSEKLKNEAVQICLNQSAARTASHLVVFTSNPKNWKRSHAPLMKWVSEAQAPKKVQAYYRHFFPFMYSSGVLNLLGVFKCVASMIIGLRRPIMRGPFSKGEVRGVTVKSAALAAENFVLAITAQGGATCMMEGLDERRMRRLLKLPCGASVVMAVAVGFEAERGTWAPRFRLPLKDILHIH